MQEGCLLLRGSLAEQGPIEVLQAAEALRASGWIAFDLGSVRGEVRLLTGEPIEEQPPLEDGRDPLDVLLEADSGSFELWQRLPPLPVTRGDGCRREGSLAIHVPADLMNYCERVGLTGRLVLRQRGRCAEALYDRGELLGIRLDGRDAEDLHAVFSWEEGTFLVEAHPSAPRLDQEEREERESLPPSSDASEADPVGERGESTRRFLRVVEMELSRIVEERERRRPASRSSPESELPRPARRHESLPPPAKKSPREATVRIVYLSAPAEPSFEVDDRTRHVASRVGEPETPLPEAAPEHLSPLRGTSEDRESFLGALGWAVLVLVLALAAIGLLSRLPPL